MKYREKLICWSYNICASTINPPQEHLNKVKNIFRWVYKLYIQCSVTEAELLFPVQPIRCWYLPYSPQINEYNNDFCTRIKWLYVITRKIIFGISVTQVTAVERCTMWVQGRGWKKIQNGLLQNRRIWEVKGLTASETQTLGWRHSKNGHQPITE